jgi:hypothetical protein
MTRCVSKCALTENANKRQERQPIAMPIITFVARVSDGMLLVRLPCLPAHWRVALTTPASQYIGRQQPNIKSPHGLTSRSF